MPEAGLNTYANAFADVHAICGDLLVQACFMFDFFDVQLADVIGEVLPYTVEAEAAFGHFLDGLIFAPALHGDAINRAHRPGAVGTVPRYRSSETLCKFGRPGSSIRSAHLFLECTVSACR